MSLKELELRSENKPFSILPARVIKAIQEQQNISERLIGWFQLGVGWLFFLGFFILLLQKPFQRYQRAGRYGGHGQLKQKPRIYDLFSLFCFKNIVWKDRRFSAR